MKKILTFLLFAPLAFSCTKESATETVKPQMMVTIEVTSDYSAQVTIPSIAAENFSGTYKKTFRPTQHVVSVQMHSKTMTTKTIKIFVNGELMAQRSGSCSVGDYGLTYDLDQY
jgi:hypothetical protein